MKYVRIEGGVKLSSFISPMLATLSEDPAFDDPKWIFEIKWDGYRAIAELNGEETKFYSRNGLSYVNAYPKVYEALKKIKTKAIIDGEVVVFDYQGKPSFNALQNYNSRQNLAIQFQAFDCLEVMGKDITKLNVLERKTILKELLPESDVIKYCDHFVGEGKLLFEHAVKVGLEGIIAKKASSTYTIGKRTKDWLKVKNVNTDDFVIVGYTDPQASRKYFGSLIIARIDKGKLIHAGEVGTGFTEKLLKELYEKLKPIERKKSPMSTPIKETKDMHWVEPHFVAQVKYTEITQDGHVRHPSFLGLRIDKQ
jgi:bifunctional non-homologous end joining protein LigD